MTAGSSATSPRFFAAPASFRSWLTANHAGRAELWVGFRRRASGRPSITWDEAVEEALCFGWIDGIRKSVDDESYAIRFTPRRRGSTWSAVNVRRVEELTRAGRMEPAGLAAFEARRDDRTGVYSYERAHARLDADAERAFRVNRRAWAYWRSRPPWYRRTATWWVVSAKREETRQRRLATLIADSAAGRPIAPLTRAGKP
jgi:uncharacterized protein YdeI (YjbR/CyaY-like superfamily)